ncbi:hypothetical protein [Vibrio diabolicus]|uniref:hypothetical protein n=1 Tax=Vibrio diabolicus TaxID=50719 RepID=UPI002494A5DF|nr:hypothetical protein [Vibrio diabolicus]
MSFEIYTKNYRGHRQSYVDTFKRIFSCEERRSHLFNRKPLLFLMVEDGILEYFYVSLLRSILGRKTGGLVFCSYKLTKKSRLQDRIKYSILRFLNVVPNVHNISIVPNYVSNEMSSLCSHWIYDPQFWDSFEIIKTQKINKYFTANKSLIISSLGEQSERKGTIEFLELCNSYKDKYNFISAGKLDSNSSKKLSALELSDRFISIDRFITDEELEDLYCESDVIWCCYRPEYDQASGIFGRAIQVDKPVIVRSGSCLHKIAVKENLSYLTLEQLRAENISVRKVNQRDKIMNMKRKSVTVMNGIFGEK